MATDMLPMAVFVQRAEDRGQRAGRSKQGAGRRKERRREGEGESREQGARNSEQRTESSERSSEQSMTSTGALSFCMCCISRVGASLPCASYFVSCCGGSACLCTCEFGV